MVEYYSLTITASLNSGKSPHEWKRNATSSKQNMDPPQSVLVPAYLLSRYLDALGNTLCGDSHPAHKPQTSPAARCKSSGHFAHTHTNGGLASMCRATIAANSGCSGEGNRTLEFSCERLGFNRCFAASTSSSTVHAIHNSTAALQVALLPLCSSFPASAKNIADLHTRRSAA